MSKADIQSNRQTDKRNMAVSVRDVQALGASGPL